MSVRNKISQSIAAGAILAMCSFGASANLLVNGSFEDPNLGGAAEAGGLGAGWTAFGGAFTISNFTSAALPPQDGVQMAKVFGVAGGFQDFATAAGDTWSGSIWAFDDSADAMGDGQVAAVNIEWFDAGGGALPTTFGDSFTGLSVTQNVWTQLTVSGVAPVGAATARFVFITGDFAGPGGGAPKFDNASFDVAAVPVPAAVWLFGSGLVGLVGVARRRKGLNKK